MEHGDGRVDTWSAAVRLSFDSDAENSQSGRTFDVWAYGKRRN